MESLNLCGPIVGSLSWELFRFAPYVNYIKKENQKILLGVYTRPSRFDLYGNADIFVPLRIKNDNTTIQINSNLEGLSEDNYNKMVNTLYRKYKLSYKIENHIYPDISFDRINFKWKFPPYKMNYNFLPRVENLKIMSKVLGKKSIFIDLGYSYMDESIYILSEINKVYDKSTIFICYNPKKENIDLLFSNRIVIDLNNLEYNKNTSLLGCVILAIDNSIHTISTNISDVTHLSLLLNKKVLMFRENYYPEFLDTINPLKTKIEKFPKFKCSICKPIPSFNGEKNKSTMYF